MQEDVSRWAYLEGFIGQHDDIQTQVKLLAPNQEGIVDVAGDNICFDGPLEHGLPLPRSPLSDLRSATPASEADESKAEEQQQQQQQRCPVAPDQQCA